MNRLLPITPGELLQEEFLQPLGVSQYRLAKAIGVPASSISEIVTVTWTPETEPALMRASLPARIGQEKPHESQTPQPRADHPQVADR
jgi:hypothetical protein